MPPSNGWTSPPGQRISIGLIGLGFWLQTMEFLRSLLLLAGLATLAACAAQTEQPLTTMPAPIVAPKQPAAAPTRQSQTFTVYFDSGRADIRASAMQIIYAAWQNAQATAPTKITITGFADSTGKKSANLALSERRAKAVAGQFAKLGLANAMNAVGKGQVAGARSAADRRVEITLEGGSVASTGQFVPLDAISGSRVDDLTAGVQAPLPQPIVLAVAQPVAPAPIGGAVILATAPAPAQQGPPGLMNITDGPNSRI